MEEKVVCLPLGRNTLYTDIETDSTKEWKTTRDRDYTKLRNVEKISLNGAQIWRERGQPRGRINSGTDSGVSPPRRSLRSLTPDQDSISFHESLGRELSRRRRSRRRSASCSSASAASSAASRPLPRSYRPPPSTHVLQKSFYANEEAAFYVSPCI